MNLPGAPIWFCAIDELACRWGHPVGRTMREAGQYLRFHGAGVVTFTCATCRPATYAFGIQVVQPDELVTFYAVTREQMEHGDRLWREGVRLRHILAALGYGPSTERVA